MIKHYNIDACMVVSGIQTGIQGSHRLEKSLNIQDCLEKSLKLYLP